MIVTLFAHLTSVLIDLVSLLGRTESEKELEIALLRQQIRILQRTRSRSPRLSWWENFPGPSGGQAGQGTASPSCSAQPKSPPVYT